jgi:transcriptional regulator GlxA family with amidase domain
VTANGASTSPAVESDAPYAVGLYLVPDFPMMAFASAIEPLRAANRLSGVRLFEWTLYSRDGKPVRASNGIDIGVHGSLDAPPRANLLLVCAGTTQTDDARLARWLRDAVRRGASVGGISLGAYALAEAGLLDGRRCAVHWESFAAFAEKYPRIRATTDLYVVDDHRYTCSGGTGALDMMLHVIALRHDRELAHDVSEQFIHPRIRSAHDKQRMALQTRLGVANQKLIDAVAMMEEALDEPRDVREIAAAVSLSPRQLERLFARYLHANPSRYYLELRLAHARHLLSQTTRPILDIAVACGFASASHFSRCYRMVYAKKPSDERVPSARAERTRRQA